MQPGSLSLPTTQGEGKSTHVPALQMGNEAYTRFSQERGAEERSALGSRYCCPGLSGVLDTHGNQQQFAPSISCRWFTYELLPQEMCSTIWALLFCSSDFDGLLPPPAITSDDSFGHPALEILLSGNDRWDPPPADGLQIRLPQKEFHSHPRFPFPPLLLLAKNPISFHLRNIAVYLSHRSWGQLPLDWLC